MSFPSVHGYLLLPIWPGLPLQLTFALFLWNSDQGPLRAQTVLFYLQIFRCNLIAYVFISNKGFTKILCTWFVYVLFKQIHNHSYFRLPPLHSLLPSQNLNTFSVNQWILGKQSR